MILRTSRFVEKTIPLPKAPRKKGKKGKIEDSIWEFGKTSVALCWNDSRNDWVEGDELIIVIKNLDKNESKSANTHLKRIGAHDNAKDISLKTMIAWDGVWLKIFAVVIKVGESVCTVPYQPVPAAPAKL